MTPPPDSEPPILDHPIEQPSAFTPQSLIGEVRRTRSIASGPIPPVCFLEFDGDKAFETYRTPDNIGLLKQEL